ncbi:UNVERIFIED_CONTAM: hypothetical protein Sangu_0678200 [Sesamum angustifolium]|uniref:Secreted protein n=1 Tax=Sesamum angustifolium TaxID=2727405 RepID=A0AAW2PQT5_9LAMI
MKGFRISITCVVVWGIFLVSARVSCRTVSVIQERIPRMEISSELLPSYPTGAELVLTHLITHLVLFIGPPLSPVSPFNPSQCCPPAEVPLYLAVIAPSIDNTSLYARTPSIDQISLDIPLIPPHQVLVIDLNLVS